MTNPWLAKVHITRITRLDTSGDPHPVRAFASVAVGSVANPSLIIHGAKIVQKPGEDVQVLMPVRSTDKFYYGVEIVDARLLDAIVEKTLDAWREAGGA